MGKEGAMTDNNILCEEEFKNCADFHGHICPGLAIGYRAAMAGLEQIREKRSADEELVAIVETDSCSVDAIQVLTGCTFGKGNFVFKDYGKHVFTILGRESGTGVRLSLKEGALDLDERHRELMQKIRAGDALDSEQEEFNILHRNKTLDILKKPLDEIFTIKPVHTSLPEKARIEPSIPCQGCGEPTMSSRMVGATSARIPSFNPRLRSEMRITGTGLSEWAVLGDPSGLMALSAFP